MVKPRSTAPSSTTLFEEPDPFTAGLEAHRAETSASLKELQTSLLASMHTQSETMRSAIMEEMRQLQLGPKSPLRPDAQSFPPPTGQNPSSSLHDMMEPVISQVVPYQPLYVSGESNSVVITTIDLSALPLYSAYVTNGMFAQNIGVDGFVSHNQIPVCTVNASFGYSSVNTSESARMVNNSREMDDRSVGQLFNQPWYYNPHLNYAGNYAPGFTNQVIINQFLTPLPQTLRLQCQVIAHPPCLLIRVALSDIHQLHPSTSHKIHFLVPSPLYHNRDPMFTLRPPHHIPNFNMQTIHPLVHTLLLHLQCHNTTLATPIYPQ